MIEGDVEAGKNAHDFAVPSVHMLLRADTGLLGGKRDGHTVLVGAADVDHILSPRPQGPHINVCGQVGAGDMAKMDRSIGIGQRRGHQVPPRCAGRLVGRGYHVAFSGKNGDCRPCPAWGQARGGGTADRIRGIVPQRRRNASTSSMSSAGRKSGSERVKAVP